MPIATAHEKYAEAVRQKHHACTPRRLGFAVGEAGDDLPSPYLKGSRGHSNYCEGLNSGRQVRARKAPPAQLQNEQQERGHFESWSRSQGLDGDFRRRGDDGYYNLFTDAAWQAWKARAAHGVRVDAEPDVARLVAAGKVRTQPVDRVELEGRIIAAIRRLIDGHAPMRVPADPTDPDLVLADCLALLRADGVSGPDGQTFAQETPT